jgi:Nucleoside 2-deoxyribosyltransferase
MDETSPKPFVFVLMPFSNEFTDIYEVGIKQACRDAGVYCERVDEQIFLENILERVYNQIAKADIVVADMTGKNPNVFYEVGYAHALNKRVILLTKNADDIPFDLKHYPHIVYEGRITYLKTQLESRIHWCIENSKELKPLTEFNFNLYIDEILHYDGMTLVANQYTSEEYPAKELILDFHNLSNNMYALEWHVGFITPTKPEVNVMNRGAGITLPENKLLYMIGDFKEVFPQAWKRVTPYISLFIGAKATVETPLVLPLIVRVFTVLGIKDFPFNLMVQVYR